MSEDEYTDARVVELLARIAAGVDAVRATLESERGSSASPLLTGEQVAALMQIDRRTLRRFELADAIPRAITINGVKRWKRADVERWLAKAKAS